MKNNCITIVEFEGGKNKITTLICIFSFAICICNFCICN